MSSTSIHFKKLSYSLKKFMEYNLKNTYIVLIDSWIRNWVFVSVSRVSLVTIKSTSFFSESTNIYFDSYMRFKGFQNVILGLQRIISYNFNKLCTTNHCTRIKGNNIQYNNEHIYGHIFFSPAHDLCPSSWSMCNVPNFSLVHNGQITFSIFMKVVKWMLKVK